LTWVVIMEFRDLQRKAVDVVDVLDRKFSVDRDLQLNFTQLMEEIGELAKDVNLKRLRKREPDKENLEGEFADVFLQLAKLADMLGVDLEEAVERKTGVLRKRHGI
jgi:NTP pyrophosphatase (non-canonical NTP hydrolase)